MKVAIIGAGLSGLSCAFELKKHNIIPTIFEQNSHIGDYICTACLNLRLFNRWISDPFIKLSTLYGLNLQPLYRIKNIEINTPAKSTCVKSDHGYIIKRGIDQDSIENQILGQTKVPVELGKAVKTDDIKDKFDYIVVATGNNAIANEMGVWVNTFTAQARYVTVSGEFETNRVQIWFNTKFAKNGFCYLIPETKKQAVIVLVVNGIHQYELNYYWKEFLRTEKIENPILESKDTEHSCGFLKQYRIGNLYFTGNTAGLTDDFIGFGAINSIESGIFAARSIAEKINYGKQIKPLYSKMVKLHEYRTAFNSLDNKTLDKVLAMVSLPVIKQLIYKNPLFKFSHASPFVKIYNKINTRK